MRRVLAALAVWAIAAPALAQEASVGALGIELISRSNAEGVFEMIPSEQVIAVMHARSGLTCRLSPANTNRLIVFPQAARGEDVACDSSDGREHVTVYATRFSFATSLDEQITGASAALRRNFPNANALPGPASVAAGGGLPPSASARYSYANAQGQTMFWRTSVAMVGDWVIKVRYQTMAPDAAARQSAERSADAIWRGVMGELMTNRSR